MSRPIRLRTSPPYADYLLDLTWSEALDTCDSVIGSARAWSEEELDRSGIFMLRHLIWLSGEVHGLIEQLQARGIDFD